MNPNNWFVLQTPPGCEIGLKKAIEQFTNNKIIIYLPHRQVAHRVNGRFKTLCKPMFPGYLFVHKDLDDLLIMCRHAPIEKKIHPLRQDHHFARVAASEMAFLLQLAGEKGIVETSKIRIDTARDITVIDGPLKSCQGRILFINKRKHKAKIILKMLNREVPVTLGLDIIESTDEVEK